MLASKLQFAGQLNAADFNQVFFFFKIKLASSGIYQIQLVNLFTDNNGKEIMTGHKRLLKGSQVLTSHLLNNRHSASPLGSATTLQSSDSGYNDTSLNLQTLGVALLPLPYVILSLSLSLTHTHIQSVTIKGI